MSQKGKQNKQPALFREAFRPTKYELNTKIIKTQKGQLLIKYGHAFFKLRSIDRNKVSEKTKKLLTSFPCWFMKQYVIDSQQFIRMSKNMVQAHPREIYIFQQFQNKKRLLSSIQSIKFPFLKILHVIYTNLVSFEQITWLDAPLLQQIHFSSQGLFKSIKSFQKTNFKHLSILNIHNSGNRIKGQTRNFDLQNMYRTKFQNYKDQNIQKPKMYRNCGTLSVCRDDLSNVAYFCKLELQKMANFHLPYISTQLNTSLFHKASNFALLQLSQTKLYKALNNKFNNKTISLSIIDYIFGRVDQNIQSEKKEKKDQYNGDESFDSDLDVSL